MKKLIIITMVVIGIIQLRYFIPITYNVNEGGHGVVQEKVTANTLNRIVYSEFNELHKTLYPDDHIMMFKYTLLDDIDSITFFIGNDEFSKETIVEPGQGEIYIALRGSELAVIQKEIKIVDKNTINTSTVSVSQDISMKVPEGYEVTMTSYSEPIVEGDIVFNEKILLFDYQQGYIESDKEGENIITEMDLSVYVLFEKR